MRRIGDSAHVRESQTRTGRSLDPDHIDTVGNRLGQRVEWYESKSPVAQNVLETSDPVVSVVGNRHPASRLEQAHDRGRDRGHSRRKYKSMATIELSQQFFCGIARGIPMTLVIILAALPVIIGRGR